MFRSVWIGRFGGGRALLPVLVTVPCGAGAFGFPGEGAVLCALADGVGASWASSVASVCACFC